MPRDFIHTGVWELYGEPFHKRWILTLKDSHAFWLLGIYVVALTLVQKRVWVSIRQYVAKWKAPVGFGDRADPFLNLSQIDALKDALAYWRVNVARWIVNLNYEIAKLFKQPIDERTPEFEVLDGGAIPLLFGTLALLNGLVFISAGVLLPLWLTNGIESPLVQSRWTPSCVDELFFSIDTTRPLDIYDLPHAQALYQLCWDNGKLSLIDKVECSDANLENFKLLIVNNGSDCPFSGDICFPHGPMAFDWDTWDNEPRSKYLQIKRHGISPRQLGLNSKIPLTINYELSCAPIKLDSFIRPAPDGRSFVTFKDDSDDDLEATDPEFTYDIPLETINGPNRLSNVNSSLQLPQSNVISGTRIFAQSLDDYFPAFHINGSEPGSDTPVTLHRFLRDEGANVFTVVYKADSVQFYESALDGDLVFQAHTPWPPGRLEAERIYPDYEATAIGCKERFQYCQTLPENQECQPWGKSIDFLKAVGPPLEGHWTFVNTKSRGLWENKFETHDNDQRKKRGDIFLALKHLVYHMSVKRQATSDRPFVRFPTRDEPRRNRGRRYQPWVEQVVSWHLIAWWSTLHWTRLIVTNEPELLSPDMNMEWNSTKPERNEWSICQSALFRDADYTNINFLGFVISVVVILSIYVFSYKGILSLWIKAVDYNVRFPALWEGWKPLARYIGRVTRRIFGFWRRLKIKLFGSDSEISGTSESMDPIGLREVFTQTVENVNDGPIEMKLARAQSREAVLGRIHDDYDDPLPMAV